MVELLPVPGAASAAARCSSRTSSCSASCCRRGRWSGHPSSRAARGCCSSSARRSRSTPSPGLPEEALAAGASSRSSTRGRRPYDRRADLKIDASGRGDARRSRRYVAALDASPFLEQSPARRADDARDLEGNTGTLSDRVRSHYAMPVIEDTVTRPSRFLTTMRREDRSCRPALRRRSPSRPRPPARGSRRSGIAAQACCTAVGTQTAAFAAVARGTTGRTGARAARRSRRFRG